MKLRRCGAGLAIRQATFICEEKSDQGNKANPQKVRDGMIDEADLFGWSSYNGPIAMKQARGSGRVRVSELPCSWWAEPQGRSEPVHEKRHPRIRLRPDWNSSEVP